MQGTNWPKIIAHHRIVQCRKQKLCPIIIEKVIPGNYNLNIEKRHERACSFDNKNKEY